MGDCHHEAAQEFFLKLNEPQAKLAAKTLGTMAGIVGAIVGHQDHGLALCSFIAEDLEKTLVAKPLESIELALERLLDTVKRARKFEQN